MPAALNFYDVIVPVRVRTTDVGTDFPGKADFLRSLRSAFLAAAKSSAGTKHALPSSRPSCRQRWLLPCTVTTGPAREWHESGKCGERAASGDGCNNDDHKKCFNATKPCNYINVYAWQGPRAWRACDCLVPGACARLEDTDPTVVF